MSNKLPSTPAGIVVHLLQRLTRLKLRRCMAETAKMLLAESRFLA
jgi:hypothetical protein